MEKIRLNFYLVVLEFIIHQYVRQGVYDLAPRVSKLRDEIVDALEAN